eukprot:Skav221251  [mRNA]  locus=scaffold1045:586069:589290:+ [translate_table: standard]
MDFSQSQILCMAETAATESTQQQFTSSVRKKGFSTLWSPPVLPVKTTLSGNEHGRGQAAGVGICSSIPIRPSRNALPDIWACSSRILHTVVQVQQHHFQLFCVYCKNRSIPGSLAYNNQLMRVVIEQASLLPIPFLILGDLNMPVESFDIWPWLEQQGYQSLNSLYAMKYGKPYPKTCLDATSPDNGIASPRFVQSVSSITVQDGSWFATHKPVTIGLTFDNLSCFKQHMILPRQLPTISIDEDAFRKSHEATKHLRSTPQTLEEWGEDFEKVADYATRNGLSSLPHGTPLPRAFRGRCQPRTLTKSPMYAMVRKGRSGTFEPEHEVTTMPALRRTKQLRRIQSLLDRYKAHDPEGDISDTTRDQLRQEWKCIVRNTAFGKPFLHWVSQFPALPPPLWPLPSKSWLYDLLQITTFEVNKLIHHDHIWKKKVLQYSMHQDRKEGSNKHAFSLVRGPDKPPVRCLNQTLEGEGILVATSEPTQFEFYTDATSLSNIHMVLAFAGPAIDFTKTWFWATTTPIALQLEGIFATLFPSQHIQRKSHACDLGFQMTYNGQQAVGLTRDRLQKGLSRLARLQAMPHCLSVKQHMVLSSVFPTIFYGIENRILPQDRLQTLRSKTADALLGSQQFLSPAIALHLMPRAQLDPEFVMYQRILQSARRFLLHASPDQRTMFFHIASRFQGTLANTKGPATTFALVLEKLGWSLDRSGQVGFTAFLI